MHDMNATLWCHAHVNRSVHRVAAATSTAPELILPVLGRIVGRRMAITDESSFIHSALHDIRSGSGSNEGAHGERLITPPPPPPLWLYVHRWCNKPDYFC